LKNALAAAQRHKRRMSNLSVNLPRSDNFQEFSVMEKHIAKIEEQATEELDSVTEVSE
jgi:hypothetical protein